MKLRILALGLALSITALAPAHAQRGAAPGNWEFLAEEKVGFGADRDIITLNKDENFYRNKAYRRLRFVANGGEVRMRAVRLVYLNGHAEDFTLEQTLRPGQQVDIDLKAERSYLRHIEMFYKAKFGISLGGGGIRVNKATVKVYAENVRGRPVPPPPQPGPPRPGPIAGWNELDFQSFDRSQAQLEMPVGRREGAVTHIQIRSDAGRVRINNIRIVYGNGQTQDFRINQRLEYGEATAPIDLKGDKRYIQKVLVSLDPSRRPGPAMLALFGKEEVRVAPLPGGLSVIAKQSFNRRDSEVAFDVGRRAGAFGELRLRLQGDSVRVRDVRVHFGNGEVQVAPFGQRMGDGDITPPIALNGGVRFVDKVVVGMAPRRRAGQAEFTLAGVKKNLRPATPAFQPDRDWSKLGQQSVGLGIDRDVLRVGQSAEWFRNRGFDKLHFVAENNEIFMKSIRVVYMNNYSEDYQVEQLIRQGTALAVDLRGQRSYIRDIEMIYRAKPGLRESSLVTVYGEPPSRRRP